MTTIYLLGIPLDLGAEKLGVDIAPNAFRALKISEKLINCGLKVNDLGNISCQSRTSLPVGNPKLKYLEEIVRVSESSAKKVFDVVKKKEKIIVLGGDHSICLGPVSGASAARNGKLGLIYIDTHGDINTDKTTTTGNIHGMHLASLLGFGDKSLKSIYNSKVKISKNNLLHIAGNDFDEEEIKLIKKEKIKCFDITEILRKGFGPVFNSIDKLNSKVKNIWVSLDLDAIDNIYAPGVGIPNKAGLTYREITLLAKYIGEKCNVVGLDLVEYNPLLDVDGKTAELSIELIAKLLGSNYSLYTSYMSKNKIK